MSSRGDEVEFHTVRLVIAQCQVDYTPSYCPFAVG